MKKPAFFSFFSVQIIKRPGYNRLVLQIGRGKVVPEPFSTESFTLDVYRYKNSLEEDLWIADLVISGEGKSVLESQRVRFLVDSNKSEPFEAQ